MPEIETGDIVRMKKTGEQFVVKGVVDGSIIIDLIPFGDGRIGSVSVSADEFELVEKSIKIPLLEGQNMEMETDDTQTIRTDNGGMGFGMNTNTRLFEVGDVVQLDGNKVNGADEKVFEIQGFTPQGDEVYVLSESQKNTDRPILLTFKKENLKFYMGESETFNGLSVPAMSRRIEQVCTEMLRFLRTKNERYGNSISESVNVFTPTAIAQQNSDYAVFARMDDKLNRINKSMIHPDDKPRKNDVVDLCGYLLLYMALNGWTDLNELID